MSADSPVAIPYNSSGTEIATASNPLRVDPTGSTTQPVSATSLPLPTGAATAAKQPALGTAGTPSADVLSVQGITSMTALKTDGSGVTQPVSGTVTAGQGTAAALNAPWPVKPTDGTNTQAMMDTAARSGYQRITDGTNVAAVKAASTAPLATDPACVVAISPNTPAVPVSFSGVSPNATDVTGTISALNGTVEAAVAGYNSVGVVLTGTWVGAVVYELSSDGGTTWIPGGFVYLPPTPPPVPTVLVALTANGTYQAIGTGALTHCRIRAAVYVSGTINVRLVRGAALPTLLSTFSAIQQNVTASQYNVSTANLASGATFTGLAESTLGVAGIQILIKTDQPVTVYVDQSGDGTNWDVSDSYSLLASEGDGRTVQAVGAYYRVRVTNTGGSTTTYFRLTAFHCPTVEAVPRNLGQRLMRQSMAVVMASDQSPIPVTSSPASSNPGVSFGQVATSATTNVVVRKTTYTEPTANAQRSVASSSANDTSAGTGARQVRITYLDATGAGPYTETITLNGTSNVNTVATNICFIEKLEVISVGSGGVNAGIISLFASTGGGGGTVATIAAGDNRTLWAMHYIQSGKTCRLTGLSVCNNSTASGNGALFTVMVQALPAGTNPNSLVAEALRLYGQSSSVLQAYNTAPRIVGPARIQVWAAPESGVAITQRASIDYYDE